MHSTSGSSGEENDKINRSQAYLLEKILRLFSLLAFLALNQSGNQFPCQSICRKLWKNREKKPNKFFCHPNRLKLTKFFFFRKIAFCAVSSSSFFRLRCVCVCSLCFFFRWNVSGRIERCKLQTENNLKQLCNNKYFRISSVRNANSSRKNAREKSQTQSVPTNQGIFGIADIKFQSIISP